MANTKVQSEQIEDGSITADKLADGTIVAAELADNAVTTAKINADAVTGAKIADDAIDSEHYTDGSIDTAHIADSQITVAKMAANSVDSDQFVDGSIDTVHIADSQVTTAKIADGNISTAKIADNAVTSAKIDTNIDIAGTFDVTGATVLDSTLSVAGATTLGGNIVLADDSANTEMSLLIRNTTVTSMLGVEGSSANRFIGSAANNMFLGTTTADGIEFATNNNVRAVIDSSGNVGIGETSPLGKLHIKEDDSGVSSVNSNFDQLVLEDDSHSGMTILSGTSGDGAIYFGDSGSNDIGQIKYKHSSNQLDLTTSGQIRLTIGSGGEVGIGATSPQRLLHLYANSSGDTAVLRIQDNGSHVAGIELMSGHGNWGVFNSDTVADALEFRDDSAGATRMLIDSSGRVNIGHTTSSANGGAAVLSIGNTAGGTINLIDSDDAPTNGGLSQIYGGNQRMYFYTGGSGRWFRFKLLYAVLCK